MKDLIRQATIINTMHPELGMDRPAPDGSRGIPFGLKTEVLKLVRNPEEKLLALPDKDILLLTIRSGSIVVTPSLDLVKLATSLPNPEKDMLFERLNGSKPTLPSMHLFIPNDGGQISVVSPSREKPFKSAEESLGVGSHDLEIAQAQIEAANAPLVIARHEIVGDNSIDREDRWILMTDGDNLFVTSPSKLSSALINITTVVESSLNAENSTIDTEAQHRTRIVNTIILEAISQGEILVQDGPTSQVDRAKAITTPVSIEIYVSEITSRYIENGLGESFNQELAAQRVGLKIAMSTILNPDSGYENYLVANQAAAVQNQFEYEKKRNIFIATYGNYGSHRCELIEAQDEFECVITDTESGLVVQQISVQEVLGENGERLGTQISWKDGEGNTTEKPVDRKFIGPAQKLRVLADTKRRASVETLDLENWKRQRFSESALATGFYTLPYGVRKSIDIETTNIDQLFEIVALHNTDRVLRERARDIAQWLERTGDARIGNYRKPTGEILPSILTLAEDYEKAISDELYIQKRRSEIINSPLTYNRDTFKQLLTMDPRNPEGSAQIMSLVEQGGVKVSRYGNSDSLLEDNPRLLKVIGPEIELEIYQKDIEKLYPEPVSDIAGLLALLKKLPLSQKEFDAFIDLASEDSIDLDTLAKSLVLNSTVFWKNQSRSSDAKVSPEQTVNRIVKVADQIASGQPLNMSIYCALCEATHPFKVLQQQPDISEFYFMKKLITMDRVTKLIHEPGIKWTIVNEATLGGGLLGLTNEEVATFQSAIESYIESVGGSDTVEIISMQDILRNPLQELPANTNRLAEINKEEKMAIWSELAKTKVVEGNFDEVQLTSILSRETFYEDLISLIQDGTKPPKHRVEVFAETLFPSDLQLNLTPDQLLSFYGDQFLGKENPFREEIDPDIIQKEILGTLKTRCEHAATFFESHMALRPLLRTLARANLIEMHPVLSENAITATITRKEDRFVFSPVDNGLFPMHGVGVLTPENKIHVVPLHKIIAQPDRYEILAVENTLVGVLDMPERLLINQLPKNVEKEL